MKSLYSSPEAKKEIESLYFAKLESLPIPYQTLMIETTFGDTNIIITGKKGKQPLVLLHGANACAPVAIETFLDLANDYRIYAIDILGQPNLSAETRPNMTDDSYGMWMYEILTRLNVTDVILVGISFGGFISWKTVVFDERRIASAFLIMPAGIVSSNSLKALRYVFLPIKLYQWQQKKRFLGQFLDALFTVPDEFAIQFLAKVFLYFEMDFSPIPLIKKAEGQKIKTPLHLIAGDKDLLFSGLKLLKRAKRLFPSLQSALLLKNSKHVTNKLGNTRISQLIREFSEEKAEM